MRKYTQVSSFEIQGFTPDLTSSATDIDAELNYLVGILNEYDSNCDVGGCAVHYSANREDELGFINFNTKNMVEGSEVHSTPLYRVEMIEIKGKGSIVSIFSDSRVAVDDLESAIKHLKKEKWSEENPNDYIEEMYGFTLNFGN